MQNSKEGAPKRMGHRTYAGRAVSTETDLLNDDLFREKDRLDDVMPSACSPDEATNHPYAIAPHRLTKVVAP